MRLNDDVAVLELEVGSPGQSFVLHLALILDPAQGPTLVDAGVPGQLAAIASLLAELQLGVADLKRIIVTHHDYDHIGSLPELVRSCGARVLASHGEAPFVSGQQTPRFATREALAARPEMRPAAEAFVPMAVDDLLADGERLDLAGGVRVIATPGHTVGHISLYLERSRTLISGDALRAEGGRLLGPNPLFTPDKARAAQSVQALAELDVATIICYHGGVVADDAGGQLRRAAAELAAAQQ